MVDTASSIVSIPIMDPNPVSDTADLVNRAKRGDHSSFVELVRVHGPRAWAAALAILNNYHDAEDAMQEGTLAAYRLVHTLRNEAAFGSWFLRIVANTCKNARKRRKPVVSLENVDIEPSHDPIPSRVQQIVLGDALELLPESNLAVVQLYFSGLSTNEVAHVLGRSPGTVRRQLSTAYGLLRQSLEPECNPT